MAMSQEADGPVHISALVDAVLRKYGISRESAPREKAVMPRLEEDFLADPYAALERLSAAFRDKPRQAEDALDWKKGQAVLGRLDAVVKEVLPGSRSALLAALMRWRKEHQRVAPRHLQTLNEWIARTCNELRREGGEVSRKQNELFS